MQESSISLFISALAMIVAIVALYKSKNNAPANQEPVKQYDTIPLQLHAYERLVLLTERISLPNLISRLNDPQLTAKQMQLLLLESIKQEFEYNSSQQIYVSSVAWEAIRNLKDQNMLLINQVANFLPPDARANDLNRQLAEIVMNQNDAALNSIVLNTLNFEVKKILNPQKWSKKDFQ